MPVSNQDIQNGAHHLPLPYDCNGRMDLLEKKVDSVLSLFEQNEARLKSLQHRMDRTEGRDETTSQDIYSLRMILLKQETQTKSVITMLKIFGSLATVLSVLLNIGRMFFLNT